ncbi:uncharacterized protein LOC125813019 [Solanum verrucosum]|uniref:uncharacterized protein LOC125813019 n=1 Tax=Solanum verrucosum TaxID=315347 RepID=UPI0020D14792|nr:uncharacterized protein LOC125813019 [Solanum verrucosum]
MAKVREFLTLKQNSLSVHEYGLKFTQLSRYAPEMAADMTSRMSLFVAGLARLLSKKGRAAMLIGEMDISRLMVYVHQVEEEKLRDREEFKNKRAKTGNEFGQQKSSTNRSSFQQKQNGLLHHLLVHAHLRTNVSTIVRISELNKLILRVVWHNGVVSFLHAPSVVGNTQSSSDALLDRAAPRGATFVTGGGTNCLYVINSHQEQEYSPDVVTAT